MSRLVGLGVGAACVATSLPQILGLSWYRQSLAFYTDGVEHPLDARTESLVDSVIEQVKVPELQRPYLTFFQCFDNNPVHRGSAYLRTGAIIGVPPTFSYQSTADIPTDSLMLGADQNHVDWDSAAGQSLLQSMVLSENAKAFAIGREINYTLTNAIYVELSLKVFFVGVGAAVMSYMDDLLQMRQRMRRPARLGVFSLVAAAFGILYLTASDTYSCWRDQRTDERTAAASHELAAGGVEFYTKTLQRNIAVRTLLGPGQGSKYTPYGNDVATWRAKHLQLTARRDLLQRIHADQQKETQDNQLEG